MGGGEEHGQRRHREWIDWGKGPGLEQVGADRAFWGRPGPLA